MNINIIYSRIPAPLDRHIPGTTITACSLLSNIANQINLQLQQSAKDTPSATLTILAEPIETLARMIANQTRNQAASANLNIILQLGASAQDGHWHPASGFTVTSQPTSKQSDQLSDLLIRQALQILGRSALSNQAAAICQRQHSTARLLDIAAAPTVLTTCLYLDNQHDASFLRTRSGIQTLATVHAAALKEYLMLNQ